jgi:FkbM family methyltransferase
MDDPGQFVDYIITQYLTRMHEYPQNNYDADRFSFDGVDRSKQFDLVLHKQYLWFFFQNCISLHKTYLRLADQASKKLFLDLIVFHLAGWVHVKLDTNTPQYWSLCERAKQLPATPSTFPYTGLFGPLLHFENIEYLGHALKVDCWRGGAIWNFISGQYYFARDSVTIAPQPNDHVVDAGACFGDTALAFAATVGRDGRVYAFEPIGKHLDIIRHNVAQNPQFTDVIRVFPFGLGNVSQGDSAPLQANFLSPGFSMNAISDSAKLPVETLDNLIRKGAIERVDFIKMDVEGFELKALCGAQETLRRFRPRLAISVYHRPQDMFEVPALLDSLGLGYKFYLDHYTIHGEETVLYATV